jgi:hypothetical protein
MPWKAAAKHGSSCGLRLTGCAHTCRVRGGGGGGRVAVGAGHWAGLAHRLGPCRAGASRAAAGEA